MKKFLLFLLLPILAFGADAANDVILSQRKADNSGFIQRNVTAVANSPIGFNTSSVPVVLTAFTHNLTTGAVEITAGGTNESITITPSGTGSTLIKTGAAVSTAGSLLVGPTTTTARAQLQVGGTFAIDAFGFAPSIYGRRMNTSLSSPGAVTSGQGLLVVQGGGYNGSTFADAGGFVGIYATENWSASAQGSRVEIGTTPNGSTSNSTRLTIGQDGAIIAANGSLTLGTAGTSAAALAFLNATSGSITVAPPTGALGTRTQTLQAVTGTFVYRDTTDTLTNKRITARTAALTDAATVTPNSDTTDIGILTTLSQATQFINPSGTPTEGQRYTIRIKSTTARALTYGSQFRGSTDLALPSTTSGGSLTDYMVFSWNAADSKWDLLGKTFGF